MAFPDLPDDYTATDALAMIEAAVDKDGPQGRIARTGLMVTALLLHKNASYGNSALDPVRVMAKDVDADAQLRVRIDDKLSRMARGSEYQGESALVDTVGYFFLLLVHRVGDRIRNGGDDGLRDD